VIMCTLLTLTVNKVYFHFVSLGVRMMSSPKLPTMTVTLLPQQVKWLIKQSMMHDVNKSAIIRSVIDVLMSAQADFQQAVFTNAVAQQRLVR